MCFTGKDNDSLKVEGWKKYSKTMKLKSRQGSHLHTNQRRLQTKGKK
jgi:hypothetical protein